MKKVRQNIKKQVYICYDLTAKNSHVRANSFGQFNSVVIYFKVACLLCFVTALTVRRESIMSVSYEKLFTLMRTCFRKFIDYIKGGILECIK